MTESAVDDFSVLLKPNGFRSSADDGDLVCLVVVRHESTVVCFSCFKGVGFGVVAHVSDEGLPLNKGIGSSILSTPCLQYHGYRLR